MGVGGGVDNALVPQFRFMQLVCCEQAFGSPSPIPEQRCFTACIAMCMTRNIYYVHAYIYSCIFRDSYDYFIYLIIIIVIIIIIIIAVVLAKY